MSEEMPGIDIPQDEFVSEAMEDVPVRKRRRAPGEAADLDICLTPAELAAAICTQLAQDGVTPRGILEPSAGEGAFIRAAYGAWPGSRVVAIEIRPECAPLLSSANAAAVVTSDLLTWLDTESGRRTTNAADLVLGNPPFSQAEKHIRALFGAMKPGAHLAFLLRTGFYESLQRLPFWRDFPEKTFSPIVPRPSFKQNKHGRSGTDSQSYGLFVWQVGGDGAPRRTPHLVWRDRTVGEPRRRKPPVVRFVAFVSPEPNTGCWLWTGKVDRDGYGSFAIDRKTSERAPRMAWRLFKGEIPEGQHVCHSCDFPPCVNPEHLFLGTVQENRADEVAKNRQARGSRNGNAVLTEAAAMEILSAYDAGEKQIDLAARHGVSPTAINLLVLGKTWKHVPKRKKGENGSAS